MRKADLPAAESELLAARERRESEKLVTDWEQEKRRLGDALALMTLDVSAERQLRVTPPVRCRGSAWGEGRFRRFLPVHARSGRTPAVQPRRRERVKVPHSGQTRLAL
ncbi:MAG TPA: hypothetical protein VGF39_14940 [Stellaceae bacterium]